MINIKTKLGLAIINLGIKIMPVQFRSKIFIKNAMSVNLIKTEDKL
ncbi:hypothetical protein [Vibrio phage LP.1]|nr:hypothetical protein [Vibrio phage LP.1]